VDGASSAKATGFLRGGVQNCHSEYVLASFLALERLSV